MKHEEQINEEKMEFNIQKLTDEQEIRQLTDLLFIYTDQKDWSAATNLFVKGDIEVDMSSLVGGKPEQMTAAKLFAGFNIGLHSGKISHHMTTNFLITLRGKYAELTAHGYAWNNLLNYKGGSDLWETWGNYRLSFEKIDGAWKMNAFRYYAKYNRGNEFVRNHIL